MARELGGEPLEEVPFKKGGLRADLVSLTSQFCIQHANVIADALMRNYNITSKWEKKT